MLDVGQLVSENALEFLFIEQFQYAVRDGHDGVTGVPAGGECVR